MTDIRTPRLQQPVRIAIVLTGLAALVAGFAIHRMWLELPWERLALSLCLALVAASLGGVLRRLLRCSWASAFMLAWALGLLAFTGPLPMLAAALMAASALAVGLWLLPPSFPARTVVAICIGLVVIGGLTGWTLGWPIHTAPLWYALLGGLVLFRRHALLSTARQAYVDFEAAVAAAPRWAGFAIMLLGLASTACWLPTMQADDLTYHLGLPSHLLIHGRYAADPAHQIWAFAPWLGDGLQGIASVLSRQEARGAVNALWLALLAPLAWSAAARLGATAVERWACVALLASFPPLVWMAAGMQTELPASVLLLALATVVMSGSAGWLLAASILFAGLAALKTMHALATLPLLVFALWQYRHSLRWKQLPAVIAAGVLLGASSYVLSWWHTGNPVLPLFNNVFASPYFPTEAYRDGRWYTGFGPSTIWDMTFDTTRYVEAFTGGIGFTMIALSGLWLLALLRPATRGISIAITLVLLLPIIPLQYARYTYPGILLLSVILVAGGQVTLGRRGFAWLLVGVCMLNLAFQANSGWLHHSAALKRTIRSAGDEARIYPYYVPERMLLSDIPEADEGLVLATHPGRGYIAELAGRGRGVLEHDPTLADALTLAEADPSGAAWQDLFKLSQARWLLVVPASASPALQQGLRASHAQRVKATGDAELWRLPASEGTRAP